MIAATILVLSNLAGIAVEFLFLLIDQIAGSPGTIAELAFNPFINVGVCLLFMLGATFVSYRDMQTTQKLQYFLVGFQVLVLVVFSIAAFAAVAQGNAFDASPGGAVVVQPVRRGRPRVRSSQACRCRSSSSGAGMSPSR